MDQRYTLTQINGVEVIDRQGEVLGTVQQLTVNVEEGYIEFAKVLIDSNGDGQGLEVRIPWSQFRLGRDHKQLKLDISRDVLVSVATRHRS